MPVSPRKQDAAIPGPVGSRGSGMPEQVPQSILSFTHGTRPSGFQLWLAAVTLVPLIGIPIGLAAAQAHFGAWLLSGGGLAVAFITGPMHVASTAFFYLDRDFRPVLAESRARCIWSLGLLPGTILALGVLGAVVVGAWAYMLILTFHGTWLFYHYQRQNFGLISFISMHVGCGRLPSGVNTALNLAALGGIVSLLGVPEFYAISGIQDPLMDTRGFLNADASAFLRSAGMLIFLLSFLLLARVVWSEPRLRESARVIGALVLGVAFFLPPVFFDSVAVGFLPLAIAHGAQYLLMMSVVSGRSSRGWLGLVAMCAVGAGAGLALDSLKAWPAILIGIGLVQVHFLVDSKVWRLREPRQRAIMGERFDFLLAP